MILWNNAGGNRKQSHKSSVCMFYLMAMEKFSGPREHCLPFDRKAKSYLCFPPCSWFTHRLLKHDRDLSVSVSICMCVYHECIHINPVYMRYIYISQWFKYVIQVPEGHYLVVLSYFCFLNIFIYFLFTFFVCY